MKTVVVLCFLVTMICSQMMEEEFTKADFKVHRMESYDRFLELAPSQPRAALNTAVMDLIRGMQIGSHLVDNGMMSTDKVAKKLLQTVTVILEESIDIPEIYAWAEFTCTNRDLPAHDAIDTNPTFYAFKILMNARLPKMCRILDLTYGPEE